MKHLILYKTEMLQFKKNQFVFTNNIFNAHFGKKIIICFTFSLFYMTTFSQNNTKFYKLYNKQEYVKCIERCNSALKKQPENLELYYIKAIAYFEMIQSATEYKHFSKNPYLDCLSSLSILSSKDSDKEFLEEHRDTFEIIKSYGEERAKKIIKSNISEAQAIHQKLNNIFNTKNDGLEFARAEALAGRYDKCYSKVESLYAKSPGEINSSHANYSALTQGAILLAENWMFSNLFTLIRTYKPKFIHNHGINEGFKKALIISIDTARTDENKTLFYEFSQKGLELYPNDQSIKKHIEKRWIELITDQANLYRSTAKTERTRKDSIYLRNTYRYLSIAKNLFPANEAVISLENSLNQEFHTIPFNYEKDNFRSFALKSINGWRTKGCDCDTGHVVYVAPVPEIEWDTTMERLANEHAKEMFYENHSEDINIKGETPWDRINTTLYKGTTYENENGTNFVQAMKMAFCIGYGHSLNGVETEEELQQTIDSVVNKWITTRNSQNCMKIMTPDVTHMALGMYGDKWVFWAITKYDILIKKKQKVH